MRKLFYFSAILLCILSFQSRSKESANEMVQATPPANIINATVALNKTYQLTFNSGEVNISKQASHFKVSQVEPGTENGSIAYKYAPAADYIGTDEVVLSITKAFTTENGRCNTNGYSDSRSTSYSTSYTTIKINITK